MAAKHREQRIIESAACPTCGARPGDPCRACRLLIPGLGSLVRDRNGPLRPVHMKRRRVWEQRRREV